METPSEQNPTFGPIVEQTMEILDSKDWHTQFAKHGSRIINNHATYKKKGEKIRKLLTHYIKKATKTPVEDLQLYTTVSMASEGKKYSLRFRGQHMCIVDVNKKKYPQLHPYHSSISNPQPWHELEPEFKKNVEVCSEEAAKFFRKFAEYAGKTKSPEHQLESLVLRNIAKKSSKVKKEQLQYMQPIMLGKGFFQLTTKLSASKIKKEKGVYTHEPKFSEGHGGGIDILARVKKGRCSRFAVIELKDQYLPNEDEKVALKQAMVYATLIAYLLADDKLGKMWYNIFRGKTNKEEYRDVPGKIDILVVAMMPQKKEGSTKKNDGEKKDGEDEFDNTVIELSIKKRTINLIPCTCFLDIDEDIKDINDAKGSYSNYRGNAKPKKQK